MPTYRRSVVFRLGTPEPVYLWGGIGDLRLPANIMDASPKTYTGMGELISLPVMRSLINGLGDRGEFTISGVSPHVLRLALEDRTDIRNAPVAVGLVYFDLDWQLQSQVKWTWRGVCDVLSTSSDTAEGGRQRTISLSVRSADTMRANPQLAFFTDQEQRRRSPDDLIFTYVSGIASGMTRRFGPR